MFETLEQSWKHKFGNAYILFPNDLQGSFQHTPLEKEIKVKIIWDKGQKSNKRERETKTER